MPLAQRRWWPQRVVLVVSAPILVVAVVQGWRLQLQGRFEHAAARGQFQACLHDGQQLQALTPWAPPSPLLRHCRRQHAAQLWQQGLWPEALQLQHSLIDAAHPDALQDRERLQLWQRHVRDQALMAFRRGDLGGALRQLEPLGRAGSTTAGELADELRRLWSRNRLFLARADQLSKRERWWEAYDNLNRIDHPWWRRRSSGLRQRVQAELMRLEQSGHDHDSHGSLPHTVAPDHLDARVRRRIAQGVPEWQAFETSCRELGGQVVEAGPDSACQR